MKIGLIARADDRGIGFQTWEFWKAMRPARTAVVKVVPSRWRNHFDRFPDAEIWEFRGSLDEGVCRRFLDGLDAVFIVETPYDWRFTAWAEGAGVKTVIQGNPEFVQPHHRPSVWWWPTRWRWGLIPAGELVPVPAPVPAVRRVPSDGKPRFVHVAGHRAIGDRNGTEIVAQAVRFITAEVKLTVIGQDGQLPSFNHVPSNVDLVLNAGGVDDRWELYRDADVVVVPRRYGGLCLPAIEAAAAGCLMLMPDCVPNDMWPTRRFLCKQGPSQRVPGGTVRTVAIDPKVVAKAINETASLWADAGQLAAEFRRVDEWVAGHTWDRWRAHYEEAFHRAVRGG